MTDSPPTPHARRSSPHGFGHRLARFLWGIVWTFLFRPSPRNLHRWRNMLLRIFGATLHARARVYPRARVWAPWNLEMHDGATIADDVDVYSADHILLEEHAIVSQYSYLCGATHDIDTPGRPLITKPITIRARAWIAADVFVGPGVEIGANTVVGARSSVFTDLPPDTICTGTPATVQRERGGASV